MAEEKSKFYKIFKEAFPNIWIPKQIEREDVSIKDNMYATRIVDGRRLPGATFDFASTFISKEVLSVGNITKAIELGDKATEEQKKVYEVLKKWDEEIGKSMDDETMFWCSTCKKTYSMKNYAGYDFALVYCKDCLEVFEHIKESNERTKRDGYYD